MASETQETLYRTFVEAAGKQAASSNEIAGRVADAAGLLLAAAGQLQTGGQVTTVVNSLFPAGGNAGSATSGGGGSNTLESIASTVLKSAFGMAPLISGLLSLFGGSGDDETPPPLVRYALPPSIGFQAAEVNGGIVNVDYDQAGGPRAYGSSTAAAQPAAQVTVNVQAMDARSFLDRSSDIAAAVRDAMLNLNAINDVVNDL